MEKILLVHSDPVLGTELAFALQHSGFRVVRAVDDRQALVEIDGNHLSLVVMAESAAKMNGDKPIVRIRELCRAPIVILGEAKEETAGIDLLEMGADAYLTSPLNFRELLARVRSLLRRGRAGMTEVARG
jgi:DNA-binding response OmpR family regulator